MNDRYRIPYDSEADQERMEEDHNRFLWELYCNDIDDSADIDDVISDDIDDEDNDDDIDDEDYDVDDEDYDVDDEENKDLLNEILKGM